MATLRSTMQKRAATVHHVRREHGRHFKVRKGWRYVLCQCKGCQKLFQVPYRDPGYSFAIHQLNIHTAEVCRA